MEESKVATNQISGEDKILEICSVSVEFDGFRALTEVKAEVERIPSISLSDRTEPEKVLLWISSAVKQSQPRAMSSFTRKEKLPSL